MAHRRQEPAARARILIVDDEPDTLGLLQQALRQSGYDVIEARDAAEGLELAENHQPDLILLDYTMPGMDGLEATRRLKSNPATEPIAVVLLTANRDARAKVAAYAAGAEHYLTKPFEVEEVEAAVQAVLRQKAVYKTLKSDLENEKARRRHLEELLVLDEKTGLYNYRQLHRKLREEWTRSERYGTPLSLIVFDLDDFKKVNDTLGHLAGDQVLREFATLVAGGARSTDIAARYGGEEFVMILPHTSGPMAERVAGRILAAVRDFVFLEDKQPTRITVSAGVATHPAEPDVKTVEGLLQAADEALYRAKRQGKDRVAHAWRDAGDDQPAGDPPGPGASSSQPSKTRNSTRSTSSRTRP